MSLDTLPHLVLALVAIAAALVFILPTYRQRRHQQRWSTRAVVDAHTGDRTGELRLYERRYPLRAQADLQRWIAADLTQVLGPTALHGLQRDYSHDTLSLAAMLGEKEGPVAATICQPTWTSIDIGEDKPLPVLSGAVAWLGRLGGAPAVLLLSPDLRYGQAAGWYVGLATLPEVSSEAALAFFAQLEAGLARSACYRGKALMLSGGG